MRGYIDLDKYVTWKKRSQNILFAARVLDPFSDLRTIGFEILPLQILYGERFFVWMSIDDPPFPRLRRDLLRNRHKPHL